MFNIKGKELRYSLQASMAAKWKNVQAFFGIDDLKKSGPMSILAALIAEFIGTLFIILLGCGSALNFKTSTDLVQIRWKIKCCKQSLGVINQSSLCSLTFGFVVFAGVVITAPISGANLNPAVTIGLFAAGRVKLIRAILYIIVQCAGGIGKLV